MPGGRGPQLADAIVAVLVDPAQSWNHTSILAAQRRWLPVWQSEQLKTLQVAVVPFTLESKKDARAPRLEKYGIDIDFQVNVTISNGQEVVSQIDALDARVESIFDYFGNGLSGSGGFQFTCEGTQWTAMQVQREYLYYLESLFVQSKFETLISLQIWGWV